MGGKAGLNARFRDFQVRSSYNVMGSFAVDESSLSS